MKKLILTTAIAFSTLFMVQQANAQVSLNINIGSQPMWGPVGYDYVNYYYLPDIDVYYDVPARRYVYLDGGVWVHRTYLPARYKNYNLYNGYKVVINNSNPWRNHTVVRNRYVSYKGRPSQVIIRDSRDIKYTKYNGKRATVTKVKVKGNNGNGNKKSFTKVKVKGNKGNKGNGRGKN